MSIKFEKVKDSLEKLLLFLNEPVNSEIKAEISIKLKDKKPNVVQLSTASDRRLFLSDHKKFNLDYEEAKNIWEYFQKNPMNYLNDGKNADYTPYEFFSEMRKAFPKLLSEEGPEYIELINKNRELYGFEPINF